MKIFDWDYCKIHAQPKRYEWLKKNQNKPITEQEFILALQAMKDTQRGRVRNHNYKITKLKWQYNNLRTIFGFFG